MSKVKILLLANNWVGLQIAKFLKSHNESIVGLGIHPPEKQRFTNEIISILGLPSECIFDGNTLRDEVTLKKIKKLSPDIILASFWGVILKEELLKIPPMGCVNFHPGLLPYNRGMNPNVWPFIEGTPAGVTLHYMDSGIDTGDIIAQKPVLIESTDTAGTIDKKTSRAIVSLFKKNWSYIKNGKIKRIQQDSRFATFHYTREIEKINLIDLEKSYTGRELIQLLKARSYASHSYAYYFDNGRKTHINISLKQNEEQKKEAHEFQEYIENTLKKLKNREKANKVPSEIRIPITHSSGALLSVLSKDMVKDDVLVKDLARWRRENVEWFPSQFPVTVEGTRKWLDSQVIKLSDRILFIIKTLEGKPYGHMGLFRFNFYEKSCEIDNVMRGEKDNPGSMELALKEFIVWAFKNLHINKLYLRTFSDNTRAISLYRKCGFVDVEKIPLYKTVDGDSIKWTELPGIIKSPDDRYHLKMVLQ